MIGPHVAKAMDGCSMVFVPFVGGFGDIKELTARTVLVNDLNREMIQLAQAAADRKWGPQLYRVLRSRTAFHPETLHYAQEAMHGRRGAFELLCSIDKWPPSIVEAAAYFVCVWMGRSGLAGTDGESKGNLCLRYDAGGGDSVVRYQSAVRALIDFRHLLRRCSFSTLDCFDFIDKCKDSEGNGIYCDPPWPDDGDSYRHKFTEAMQRQLAARLVQFNAARVVCRFGDHPLIRELYPESLWNWHEISGRTQANKTKREVLLIRN
jgi:site-specific DNA-adenine methylase